MSDKKPINISEEERKRRSDRAKALNKKGKFGGPNQGQGRKKQTTANEKAAEEASRNAHKIIEAILDALENGKPAEKLKAAQLWLEIEAKETDRQERKEFSQLENASKDELIKYVLDKMLELQNRGIKVPNYELESNLIESSGEEITDGA
jgi:hypothetical protein